jgi:predicted transcriptional regulator
VLPMKLAEIARTLEAIVLSGADKLDIDIVRCGASDLMSDILAGPADGSLLLTGLATLQTVRTASIAGVGAIVFVRGKIPPPEVVDLARTQGLPLISTPCSMFVSCGRLHAFQLTGLNGNR